MCSSSLTRTVLCYFITARYPKQESKTKEFDILPRDPPLLLKHLITKDPIENIDIRLTRMNIIKIMIVLYMV